MKKKAKVADTTPIVLVGVIEAKPNKMFTEEQRAMLRFVRYSRPVPCQECGKKSKTHWTMLCEFQAMTLASFTMVPGKKLLPMAPVCQSHPLAPARLPKDDSERDVNL